MEQRLQYLKQLLRKKRLDAVIISSPANIVYFSDFSGFSSIERDGYLFITQKIGYIVTNPLYKDAVKEQVTHLTLLEYSQNTPLSHHLSTLVTQHKLQRVGFEADNLTVAEWNYLKKCLPKLLPINLQDIRARKHTTEIKDIAHASHIADRALKTVQGLIKPGMTEQQLVFILENEIQRASSDIAFPTIVAFGKNAAIPHHKSDTTKLKKNDVILIDFGAVSTEYRSDMTRTFFIGKASQTQATAYHAVLEAQQQAVAFIENKLKGKERIIASEVDAVSRGYLLSLGYPSIPHSLGHGIGLEVHEAPHLSPKSNETLSEGMVFSIEPGVYFPDTFGIRIEDLYALENGKLKRLTHFPSQLQEI